MSNLIKSKLSKFTATIFTISSIVAIFIAADKAEAIPLNTIMPPGSSVKSNNQCFRLDAQTDGNLVIYKQSNGQALWDTRTYGRNIKQTIFQSDGNLVIYNTSNNAVWASGTDRRGAANLYMQDDGNLVIYNSQNQPLWASNTVSSCGNLPAPTRPANSLINNTTMSPGTTIKSTNQCFSLNAQSDGNLVLYRQSNGQALWDTKTYGKNVKQTIFQNDGNLVIYNTSNQAVWASNTDRRGGTRVTVQDDGNFVMYNAQNQALWATNTVTSCNPPPPPLPTSPAQPVGNISNVPGNCHFGETCALNAPQKHTGVDYMNPAGTQVSATCAGTVKYAFTSNTGIWDRFTIIEHKNCGGYATLYGYYGHINPTVRAGASVSRGQIIGSVADWPVNNSHLHFGLSTQLPLNGWGYQVGTLSQSGWIDPIVFGRNSGWR
jgi:murein DD-endopeptidase MepM/ murein hydrolase activator NlpD